MQITKISAAPLQKRQNPNRQEAFKGRHILNLKDNTQGSAVAAFLVKGFKEDAAQTPFDGVIRFFEHHTLGKVANSTEYNTTASKIVIDCPEPAMDSVIKRKFKGLLTMFAGPEKAKTGNTYHYEPTIDKPIEKIVTLPAYLRVQDAIEEIPFIKP